MTEKEIKEFVKNNSSDSCKDVQLKPPFDNIYSVIWGLNKGFYHTGVKLSDDKDINKKIDEYMNFLWKDFISDYNKLLSNWNIEERINKFGFKLFTNPNMSNVKLFFSHKNAIDNKKIDIFIQDVRELRKKWRNYLNPRVIETLDYFGESYKLYVKYWRFKNLSEDAQDILQIMDDINLASKNYLKYLRQIGNQCAYTDALIEHVIESSNKLKKAYNKMMKNL